MHIAAHCLSWTIGDTSVVSDISMEVHSGEMLGLVGPNGSGKSTLMRLISGIQKPLSGHVLLGGRRLSDLSRREVARRIAVVEQSAETSEQLIVRDVVALGRTPWLSPFAPWSSKDDQKVAQALEQVGMTRFADRQWRGLSGGEKQRVQIARALAQDPKVLILDEPTNHLDIQHQLGILELVRALGKTTIIALHDLNYAYLCDRVAVISKGQLKALGAPECTLTDTLIREVFGVGVRFIQDPIETRPFLRFSTLQSDSVADGQQSSPQIGEGHRRIAGTLRARASPAAPFP